MLWDLIAINVVKKQANMPEIKILPDELSLQLLKPIIISGNPIIAKPLTLVLKNRFNQVST